MNLQMLSGIRSRVVISALVVIAGMLALQSALSSLKFRTLVIEATSSRLQVTASAIDVVIQRAEAVGLSMHEISDLVSLIERERMRDPKILQIFLVNLQGTILAHSGQGTFLQEDMSEILPRVLVSNDKTMTFERGELLYASRILRDSSNSTMGAIVISELTENLLGKVRNTWTRLALMYLGIFAVVALFVSLFTAFQLSTPNRLLRRSDKADLDTLKSKGADELKTQISNGKKAREAALLDLSKLSNDNPMNQQSNVFEEK
ncbi:hypothetical protein [Pseudovibrio ascidiaceicola]|uniref:hypothetical protein n=1 Tax=Pseudovibrio ascidiaceicola TaxID=285279 RepID=UPI000D689AA9|nr:hypothetical protein [Pseudovibrio ascidiaceicola]